MKKISLLLIILLSCTFQSKVSAQVIEELKDTIKSANELLDDATDLYAEGKLKETVALLKPLINDPKKLRALSRDGRAEVYRIAAQSYLILNVSEKATICTKKMLAYRPNYKDEMRDDDLSLFKEQVVSLHALPQLMLGVTGGANITFPQAVNEYPILISSGGDFSKSVYTSGFKGVQLGLSGEFAITKRFAISADAKYITQSFEYSAKSGVALFNHSYQQSLSYFEIPVVLRLQLFPYKKIKPFVEGGIFAKSLLNSNRKTTEQQNPLSELPLNTAYGSWDMGFAVGGGVGYFMKKSCIKANARMLWGIDDVINENNRLINNGLVSTFVYGYYDDMSDPRLNNVQISLSYYYYLTHRVFK